VLMLSVVKLYITCIQILIGNFIFDYLTEPIPRWSSAKHSAALQLLCLFIAYKLRDVFHCVWRIVVIVPESIHIVLTRVAARDTK